jgi:autotransporter-associated beta strand protein
MEQILPVIGDTHPSFNKNEKIMKFKAPRLFTATPLLLALTMLSSQAIVYDWDNGSGDGLWNTSTNWTPDGLPTTGDNVLVTVDGGAIKTITLDSTPTNSTILEVGLARTGNGTATVNHTGGTLTVTGWFNLGQGFASTGDRNGTGIWNMSGSSTVNATHANGGLTTIGAGFTPTGFNTGILNITDSARFLQTANDIHVGGEGAGQRARGIINLSGSGTLTNTANLSVGVAANNSTGVVNMSGTSTLTTSRFLLGVNNGATGAINQSGGAASTTSALAASLSLGHATGGFGSYSISGGTLSSAEISIGSNNAGAGGSGIMNVSGGTVTNTGWLVLNRTEGISSQAQNAVLNVSGGTVNFAGSGLVANWGSSTTNSQNAAITVSGTGNLATTNNTGIRLSWTTNANNRATLNLNGGTTTVNNINGGTRGFVNLNGGVLRATADNAAFVTANEVQVRSGGAIIDSAGFNIGIGQALLAPASNGITTIAVTNGGSGYISAPILSITGGTGAGATAVANMEDDGTGNGTLRIASITVTGAGNYTVAPTTITQTGGAPTTAATLGTISTAANVSGGLTKQGLGNLTLTGANTFTGQVNVAQGGLIVGTGGQIATGSAMFVGNGSTAASASVTGGAINRTQIDVGRGTGTGVLNVSSGSVTASGEIWLGSNSTGSSMGVMNISGGTVTTGSWLALGRGIAASTNDSRGVLNVSGGTLNVGAAGSLSIGAFQVGTATRSEMSVSGGTVNIQRSLFVGENANGNLDISGGTVTVGLADISVDRRVVVKNTLNLRGGTLSTHLIENRAGATSILNLNGGVLQARSSQANFLTGLAQANVYSGGAIFDTNGFDITVGQALNAASGSGVSTIAVTNGGTGFSAAPIVEITGGGGTGATAVANIDASGVITGITITNAGTGYTSAPTFTLVGGGGTGVVLGTANLATNVSGGLTKNGLGTLTLTNVNTFTGGTNVTNGTLVLGHATNTLADTGAVTVNGGILSLGTNSDTVGAVTLTSGSINSSTGTLNATSFSVASGTISARLAGAGTLTKTGAGTVTLSGTNSYTGNTLVQAGELVVDGVIAANTTTTVESGATISGSGSVGSLTIAAGGSLNPGNSPGTLTVNGAYSQAGTLVAEITGLSAGTQHDQVIVNGSVSLTGSLSVLFSGTATYAEGDMIFLLVNDGTDAISGTFAGLSQGATVTTYGGWDWIISYNANSGVTPAFSGGNDIALRAVPEPSAALLGGLGALALLRRRRKDVA